MPRLSDYNIGSQGQGVTDLQTYLNDVGFAIDVDGVYGPQTQAAVRAFQQARGGMAIDGIAGPETLVALAMARSEGWTMPEVPVTQGSTVTRTIPVSVSPAHTPGTSVMTPTQPGTTGVGAKMNPLFLLVGLAIFLWWRNRSKKSSSAPGFSSVEDDEFRPEEDEEEEEEEESEDDE